MCCQKLRTWSTIDIPRKFEDDTCTAESAIDICTVEFVLARDCKWEWKNYITVEAIWGTYFSNWDLGSISSSLDRQIPK